MGCVSEIYLGIFPFLPVSHFNYLTALMPTPCSRQGFTGKQSQGRIQYKEEAPETREADMSHRLLSTGKQGPPEVWVPDQGQANRWLSSSSQAESELGKNVSEFNLLALLFCVVGQLLYLSPSVQWHPLLKTLMQS